MKKKEILHSVSDEVAQTLERIEEATLEEEFERKRLGLTQKPDVIQAPRDIREKTTRPIERKEGLGLGDYIKEWREANRIYIPENIDTDRIDIANTTGVEIPFEFVDYLIGKAIDLMESKNIHLLDEIKQIRIRWNKNAEELIVMAKDIRDVVGLFFFEPEPPFGLKMINSHLGVHTF